MNNNNGHAAAIVVGIVAFFVFLFGVIPLMGTTGAVKTKSTPEATSTTQEPKTGKEIETKVEIIGYSVETIEDGNLEYGKTATRVQGINGERTYTYEVTYENGKETSRQLLSSEITKQPVTKIIAKGTKVLWHCVDATSYDKNPYNDNKCTSSTGDVKYVSDSQARQLDPTYSPGKSGHWYYNSK